MTEDTPESYKIASAVEVQENLIQCFISGNFTVGDALKIMSYVTARLIVNSGCSSNTVKDLILDRIPAATLTAVQALLLDRVTEDQTKH